MLLLLCRVPTSVPFATWTAGGGAIAKGSNRARNEFIEHMIADLYSAGFGDAGAERVPTVPARGRNGGELLSA